MKEKNNKNNEKDVILINRMCTGTYTINNIGHEIINYFKASDGNIYIYISPYGTMDKKYDNRIKTILLTSSLSNHKIEIIAKIDEPTQEILFKENKNIEPTEIHRNQVKKYENVLYCGKTLEEIFKYNYKNEEAIHITFKTTPKNMKKPKNGKHIYITDDESYKKLENTKNCKYIIIKKNLASSSLKQYFEQVRDKDDYNIITNCLEEEEWEDFNPEEITERITEEDEKINFLQLIEKEDEEQIYTNLIWYWFSRKGIFNKFLEFIGHRDLIDKYDIQKEKVVQGGRTDILALGEKNIIVIENKIMSGINGIEDEKNVEQKDGIYKRTQLSKYIIGIKEKQEEGKLFNKEEQDKKTQDKKIIKGFIFIPDYRVDDFNNEIHKFKEDDILKEYYEIIKYTDLYNFFNRMDIQELMLNDLYGKKYYLDFLRGIEFQKQSNLSEKNRIEMKRKFIHAIKYAGK